MNQIRRRNWLSRPLFLERLEDRTTPAAIPAATLGAVPTETLLGENFSFSVGFDNTSPADIGYGPFVDLYLPATGVDGAGAAVNDGITFVSATYLGSTVQATTITLTSAGVPHPYAKGSDGQPLIILPPSGFQAGDQLVVLQVPYGSFTPAQPPVNLNVTAKLSNLADVDTPLPILAQGGFRFGNDPLDNPAADPTITGPTATSSTTPILLRLTKTYLGTENETATGPNFPRGYQISVDIADGQTITNLDLTDKLPPELQFIAVTSTSGATTAISTPSTTTPGGTLTRRFASVTGTTSAIDAQMTFTYYVPLVNSSGTSIIDPTTGDDATAIDDSSAQGNWIPLDPRDPPTTVVSDVTANDHTLTLMSLATQKTSSIVSDVGAPGLSPGDTIEYTLNFQVSDYFAFQNVQFTDLFSDGQEFVPGSATLNATDGHGVGGSSSGAFAPANFTLDRNFTGGSDRLIFLISQELAARGFTPNGQLVGGAIPAGGTGGPPPQSAPPLPFGPTFGTVTFRTIVRDKYEIDFPSGDPALNQGDPISNAVTISGDLLNTSNLAPNGNSESDTSSSQNQIATGSFVKTVYAVNGAPSGAGTPQISPGDTVTYRLRYSLPSGDVENLKFTAFPPLPIFDVDTTAAITGFDAVVSGTSPAAGRAQFGPDDTFFARSGIVPAVGLNSAANSITFTYGTYDDPVNTPVVVDILFTVTVSTEPFADQLLLNNGARVESNNTVQDAVTGDGAAAIVLSEPKLNITKGIVAASNSAGTFTPTTVGPVTFNAPGTVGPRFSGPINSAGLASNPIDSNLANVDQADLVTFAIVIENTGSGPYGAFDLLIRDTLPEGLAVPNTLAGLNLRVTDGNNNQIDYVVEEPIGFSLLGTIRLVDPSSTQGAIGPGLVDGAVPTDGSNIVIITFDLLTSGNQANQLITDVATLASYANTEGGQNFVPGGLTDDAQVEIAAPEMTKELLGTEFDTPGGVNTFDEAVIGELVTYRVVVTVPEGTTPGAMLVDTLDPQLAFVGMVTATASSGVSLLNGGSLIPVSITDGGRTITWDFGDISNQDTDNDVPDTIELIYTAVVVNTSSANANVLVNNSAKFTYTGETNPTTVSAPNVRIIEPQVKIDKSVSVDGAGDTGDAGDPFVYTIVMSNPPGANQFTADAFDLTFSDQFMAGAGYPLTLSTFSVTDSGGLVTDALFELVTDGSGRLVLQTKPGVDFDLPVDAARTITIQVFGNISGSVQPGEVIPNTAEVQWTSLDGDPGIRSPYTTDSTERTGAGGVNDYVATDSADIHIFNVDLVKTVVATSENATTDPASVVVGEIIRYRVTVAIPDFGTPTSFQFLDLLPAGVQLIGDGLVAFVTGPGDSLTSSTLTDTDGIPPNLYQEGNENNVDSIVPEFVIPDSILSFTQIGNQTQVTFNLGMVTNPATPEVNDREYVVAEFNVLVLNSLSNQAGTVLTNQVFTVQGGVQTNETASTSNRVAEPSITDLEKEVIQSPVLLDAPGLDTQSHDAGDLVHYGLRYSNAVGPDVSTAYDVRVVDNLPSAKMVLVLGSIQVYVNGTPVGFTNNSLGNSVDVTLDEVLPGDTVVILYDTILTTSVVSGEVVTNTANLSYTSLPGPNGTTSNPTGSANTGTPGDTEGERTGDGGSLNDYFDSDTANLAITAPELDKNILTTSLSGTGSDQFDPVLTDLAIGELVTYRVTITVPEGTSTLLLTDLLPTLNLGTVEYVSAAVASIGSNISGSLLQELNPPVVSGSLLTFDFGTVVNRPDNVQDEKDQITIDIIARATDGSENQAGVKVVNTATLNFGTGSTTADATAEIVEPALTVDKAVAPAAGDAGDVVTYTVVLRHDPSSTAPAYNVDFTDDLLGGTLLLVPGSVTVSDPTFQVILGNGGADASILIHGDLLPLGQTVTVTYQAVLPASVLPGSLLTNKMVVPYHSAPTFARDYSTSDTADVSIYSNTISGVVYRDRNNNGIYEPGIGDMLITSPTTFELSGTDHLGNTVLRMVPTSTGTYTFDQLRPGTYSVREVDQPSNFLDGIDSAGTPFGGTGTLATDARNPSDAEAITGIVIGLSGNKDGINYNFGELRPSDIGDFVWDDLNGNGRQDAGEPGINNVGVLLTGTDDSGHAVSLTMNTDTNGAYTFDNLRPGTYQVTFTAPAGFVFTVQNSAIADKFTDSDANPTTGQTLSSILAQSETDPSRDAGLYRPVNIGDFVWYDVNGDGVQDPGEPGISGATVTVVWLGPDGVAGGGDDQTYTTTTDSDGTYHITDLHPGSYTASVSNQQAGLTVQTFGVPNFTLVSGTDRDDIDFGFRGAASISGFVYVDLNNDGVFDSGETPLPGVSITLTGTDALGVVVNRTLLTLADGSYSFTDLAQGTYTLTEPTQPTGLLDGKDTPGTPFGGTAVPPPLGDRIFGITIPAAGNLTGINYNFGELTPADLGDFVWEDLNGNGRQDAGEPGLDGVTVTLTGTDDLGSVSLPTATTGGGAYSFSNLRPGNYTVTFTPLNGYVFTTQDSPVATAATDSNANPATGQAAVTLAVGESNVSIDAGLYRVASIGDFVWYDVNRDGAQDPGEPGIPNVGVTLDSAGLDGVFGTQDDVLDLALQNTTATGGYVFSSLPPGTYRVRVDSTTLPSGVTTPTYDLDGIATADQAEFPLVSAQNRTDVDFGFAPDPQLASLGDLVWYDVNRDGSSVGEPGIANVLVSATWFGFDGVEGTTDDVTYSATTDANGVYGMSGLPFGNYRVAVNAATLPPNLVATYDLDSGITNADGMTLAMLSTDLPVEDGADFGYTGQAGFGDRVWLDFNGDGLQDATEPGLVGVTITATWAGPDNDFNNAIDNVILTTTTGANGIYGFANLPPGLWRATVTGGLPAAVTNTGDPDGGADSTADFALIATLTRSNIDFGYQGNNSLAGYVYRDFNVNGLREPAAANPETGIGGVTITLTGTDSIGTTFTLVLQTLADGSYFFDGLPDGDYLITETQPPSVFTAGQAGFYDGLDSVGTAGGDSPTKNQFHVQFSQDIDGTEYNFGENPPGDPFGYVYQDLNVNGIRDPGEPGIPGVTITLSGVAFPGTPLEYTITAADLPSGSLTTQTDATGLWVYPLLPPGTYSFVETQPGNFTDGEEQDADPNGPFTVIIGPDRFDNVVLNPFPTRGPFNFGEIVQVDPIPPIPPFPPPPVSPPSKWDLLAGTTPMPTPPSLPQLPNFAEFGAPAARAVSFAAVAQDVGGGLVRVFDFTNGNERFRFQPYGDFTGGIRVTIADVTRDGVPDIITVPGPGGGPVVRVFDGNTGALVRSFMSFDSAFRGGLFVAAADFNGDFLPDIVVTPDAGGGPVVQIYDGATGGLLANFMALDPTFRGGLRPATGDVNNDGTPDLLLTAGVGGGPRVAGYNGTTLLGGAPTRLFGDFFGFAPELRSGFWITSADVNGDGFADVLMGAGDGGAPRVVVYDGKALATGGGPVSIGSFFAGDPNTRNGVRIAAVDLESDGQPELLAAGGPVSFPIASIYDPATGARRDQFYAFPPDFLGGVFVG